MASINFSADEIQIEHMNNAMHWRLIRTGNSVEARLIRVAFFDIRAHAGELTPGTEYGAFFVYKIAENAAGFDTDSVEFVVADKFKEWCLNPARAEHDGVPTTRQDGWLEISMGSFHSDMYLASGVDLTVTDHNVNVQKSGLTVKGFEVRPI